MCPCYWRATTRWFDGYEGNFVHRSPPNTQKASGTLSLSLPLTSPRLFKSRLHTPRHYSCLRCLVDPEGLSCALSPHVVAGLDLSSLSHPFLPPLCYYVGRSPPRPPTGGRESCMPRYWGSSRAPFISPPPLLPPYVQAARALFTSPPLLPPYVQAAGVRPLCLTVSLYPPTGPFTLFPSKPLHTLTALPPCPTPPFLPFTVCS